ncbi:MAG: ATPase [Bacteroidales bacterium]|nr:ATPase [Bacteroidales bacterium]
MILIADSGATKTEWLVKHYGQWKKPIRTAGFNPWQHKTESLKQSVLTLKRQIDYLDIEKLVFYGAGCGTQVNQQKVLSLLSELFPTTKITVSHDLMASAHALLGHEAGIACILGTGSNACLFDGEKITAKITSLGYILGDEGSGAHIGKMLCSAFFRQQLPKELADKFAEAYALQLPDFLTKVYHQPGAAAYLADFSRFAYANKSHSFIQSLVSASFNLFIEYYIGCFNPDPNLAIGFTGSVAFYFQDELRQQLNNKGFTVGKFMRSPAQGLMDYYDKF